MAEFRFHPKIAKFNSRAQNGQIATPLNHAASWFLHGTNTGEKYRGLRQMIMLMWPEFVHDVEIEKGLRFIPTDKWNPWLERTLMAFTNDSHAIRRGENIFRTICLTGCAGAGKTQASGLYAVAWWACDPKNSIAILTSTTIGMVRHRIWPVISHYRDQAYDLMTGQKIEFGHMVESQLELRAEKGDAKHAIFALAVAHGETQKAIQNLKGMHAPRILLIVDEANGTPEAILENIPNLRKAARDMTVIIIGNPASRLDPHGRALTPDEGWGIFNEDLIEWKTKSIPGWQLDSGIALRFDGRHSPNVVSGKNLHPYIYSVEDWKIAQENINTFAYWTQDRGMHPPEGFSNTVFNEQLFWRCIGDDPHFTFNSERMRLGFLDPAFGGDACILQFGEMGDVDGKKCLQLTDWLEVPIDPNANTYDVDYQIARRVQQECITRRVLPNCFGLDATGIGRGVAAILAAEWSPQIHYMNWGTSATERPSAQNDGRPSREVYANFVTELWYSVREGLETGQIKGFSNEGISQACSRMFKMSGKKYQVEPKDEMRARLRFSPDEFDAICGCWEVARKNGLEISGKIAQMQTISWERQIREIDQENGVPEMSIVTEDGGWTQEDAW